MNRITDRPNMGSAVDRGRKALTQQHLMSTRNLIFYRETSKIIHYLSGNTHLTHLFSQDVSLHDYVYLAAVHYGNKPMLQFLWQMKNCANVAIFMADEKLC